MKLIKQAFLCFVWMLLWVHVSLLPMYMYGVGVLSLLGCEHIFTFLYIYVGVGYVFDLLCTYKCSMRLFACWYVIALFSLTHKRNVLELNIRFGIVIVPCLVFGSDVECCMWWLVLECLGSTYFVIYLRSCHLVAWCLPVNMMFVQRIRYCI
jgi:hypothetical protein